MNDPRIPIITADNRVQCTSAEPIEAHLYVSRTLELLAANMNAHPEHIRPVDSLLVDRIIALVGQADVDLNTPLLAEDE